MVLALCPPEPSSIKFMRADNGQQGVILTIFILGTVSWKPFIQNPDRALESEISKIHKPNLCNEIFVFLAFG